MSTNCYTLGHAEMLLAARRRGEPTRILLGNYASPKRKALPHKVKRMLRDWTRAESTMQQDAHRALILLRRKPTMQRQRPRALEYLTRDGSDIGYSRRSTGDVGAINIEQLLAAIRHEDRH